MLPLESDKHAMMTSGRAARYFVGAILGAAGLYASFASVEWPQFTRSFSTASPVWVTAAVVSIFLTLAVVTTRSALLLNLESSALKWRRMWDAVIVGQAVNIAVPLRFGEGARVAFTCSALTLPVGRVLVGLALERLFDISAFAVTVLLVTLSGVTALIPGLGAGTGSRAITLAAATVAGAAALVWLAPAGARAIVRRVGSESRLGKWIETERTAVRSAWADATRPHLFLKTVPLTALMTIGAASTNFLVFKAFNLQVPLITALALLVVLQIGTTLVSVPGNLGVFHYLTVLTLGALSVPRPDALAVAVVLHAVSIGPKVLLAAWAFARTPLAAQGPGLKAQG